MRASLTIVVPCAIPPELNPNWQYHGLGANGIKAMVISNFKLMSRTWAIDARNRWWWANSGREWVALEKARLIVTIILPPRAKRWDETNVRAALKPLEDGLVQAGIIVDDSPAHLTWQPIRWERAPEAAIRIEVEEILKGDK